MHSMSNDTPAPLAGALFEDAIAAVLLDEMKAQRYTATEIQNRTGVKPRSFQNYLVNRSREIPTSAWVAIGAVLGWDEVEVIRRARTVRDSFNPSQVQLLSHLTGKTRVDTMRQIMEGRGEVEDPPDAANGRRTA